MSNNFPIHVTHDKAFNCAIKKEYSRGPPQKNVIIPEIEGGVTKRGIWVNRGKIMVTLPH